MKKYYHPYTRNEPLESTSRSRNESPKRSCVESVLPELSIDPGHRLPILSYDANIQEQVCRAYLLRGPRQPRQHNFPQKDFPGLLRRFNPSWFDKYGTWLEYSILKDAAFCLYCYLFKSDIGDQGGEDAFVGVGFTNWKKADKLRIHEGSVGSSHRQALQKGKDLLNQKQHITTVISKISDEAKRDYRVRLTASIVCIRFLLRQGLPFRGHDESELSSNQGNFLELLKLLSEQNEDVRAVSLTNAPENNKLTSPDIQRTFVTLLLLKLPMSSLKNLVMIYSLFSLMEFFDR